MGNIEEEYLRDKKYIHDTLEHTRDHMERLYGKMDDFKIETTKSIAIIQTKLAMYSVGVGVVVGVAMNLIAHFLKGQ